MIENVFRSWNLYPVVIVDLGYWDFNLLWEIQEFGGFFLSRIKSKAVIYITEIVQGKIAKKYIGSSLLSVPVKRKRSNILEVMIEKMCDKGTLCCRAVCFWNPSEKCYHWYITNLKVAALMIYPLYRLRWQIELIFKACKQSLNVNRLTSNNSIRGSSFLKKNLSLEYHRKPFIGFDCSSSRFTYHFRASNTTINQDKTTCYLCSENS